MSQTRAQGSAVAVGWSFEDGTTTGWGAWFGNATVSAVAGVGRTGSGALRADTNAATQTTAFTSAQTYDVSAYMKPLATPKYRGAEVQVYDAANNAISLPLAFAPDANGWVRASGRITLPPDSRLVVLGFDAGGVSFLLDDVTLVPASTATPLSPSPTVTTGSSAAGPRRAPIRSKAKPKISRRKAGRAIR